MFCSYWRSMGDVRNSTRSRSTHLLATHLSAANGFVAVEIRNTGFRSTQQMATTFLLRCIFTAMVSRGSRLVFGNPAKDKGKPLRDFLTVPVVQNPHCMSDMHNCRLLKKLSVTITWPLCSRPRIAIRTASSPILLTMSSSSRSAAAC
jgi:hypothetical protein